jgi:hypothetical protein
MTAVVHEARPLSSVFMDGMRQMQCTDELQMVRLLTDERSDRRDDGLELLRVHLQSAGVEQLTLSDPHSVFQGLAHSLSDNAWETRHKSAKLIGELVSRLDADVLETTVGPVLPPMVHCLGDDKSSVCEVAARTLRRCAQSLADSSVIVHAVVQYGLISSDSVLKKSLIENIPLLFIDANSRLRSANLKPLVSAIIRDISGRGDELYSVHCLKKIEEFIGKKEFNSYISGLSNSLRTKYDMLLKQYDTHECHDESGNSNHVHMTSGGRDGSDVKQPQVKAAEASRRSSNKSAHVDFGVIPSSIIDKLRNSGNDPRAMSKAIEELHITIDGIANIGRTFGTHLPDFIKFLTTLLEDDHSFQASICLKLMLAYLVA